MKKIGVTVLTIAVLVLVWHLILWSIWGGPDVSINPLTNMAVVKMPGASASGITDPQQAAVFEGFRNITGVPIAEHKLNNYARRYLDVYAMVLPYRVSIVNKVDGQTSQLASPTSPDTAPIAENANPGASGTTSHSSDDNALSTRKAADQGDAVAQYNLGNMYFHGYGVLPKDYAQAAGWYRKAAVQGDADAQVMLGWLYCFGFGVPHDDAQAYFWLSVSASGKIVGNKQDVAKLRNGVASQLAPADLSRVQNQVRQWTDVHPQQDYSDEATAPLVAKADPGAVGVIPQPGDPIPSNSEQAGEPSDSISTPGWTPGASSTDQNPSSNSSAADATATNQNVVVQNRNFSDEARFDWYVDVVKRTVAQNWYIQLADPDASMGRSVVVTFLVHRDGSVSDPHVLRSSGVPSLDLSAIQAVERVATFGPLPAGYPDDSISVAYTFTYDRNTRP